MLKYLTGNQLRQDLTKWLSPLDPSINYNTASDARHEGTALWFTQSSTFKNWTGSSGLLWIYGKRSSFNPLCSCLSNRSSIAGAGKSVLTYVIHSPFLALMAYPTSCHSALRSSRKSTPFLMLV